MFHFSCRSLRIVGKRIFYPKTHKLLIWTFPKTKGQDWQGVLNSSQFLLEFIDLLFILIHFFWKLITVGRCEDQYFLCPCFNGNSEIGRHNFSVIFWMLLLPYHATGN